MTASPSPARVTSRTRRAAPGNRRQGADGGRPGQRAEGQALLIRAPV